MTPHRVESSSNDIKTDNKAKAVHDGKGKSVLGVDAKEHYENLEQLSTREDEEELGKLVDPDDNHDSISEWNSVHSGDDNKEGHGKSRSNQRQQSQEEQEIIAKKESQAIVRLKFMVLAVLIGSMVAVACVVYFFMSRQEWSTFTARYDDAADKVFESVGTTLHLTLGAIDALLVEMVALARFSNMTWPFVTVPDIAVQLAKIRSLSHAFIITEYLLVTGEQRADWEKYASTHNGWMDQSISIQKGDPTYKGVILENYTNEYYISNDEGAVNTTGPFLPTWQGGPVIPTYAPYNWDGFTFAPIRDAFSDLFTEQRVVIAQVSNLPDPMDEAAVSDAESFNGWAKDYISPDENPDEPTSDIYYPIIDTAADTVQLFDNAVGTVHGGKTVGFLGSSLYWRDLLKGILPSGTKGVIVVIGNECGQMFTYQINGPSLVYLGRGDLHDHSYDDMGLSETFHALKEKYSGTNEYTGIPLTNTNCPYWIRLYPSKTLQHLYTSHNPIIFACTSACIFLFTSIVFLMYDLLVERRQRKVLRQALQTSAIVSSLFPSVVRDRMFKTNDDRAKGNKNAVGYETPKNKLKVFMRADTDKPNGDTRSSPETETASHDRPIADLFTDTTVLFADISGFTAWSSMRQPSQVFILLESLYGAFDQIATRRDVFKVETIGDSYVAVTGLPEPRADHALQMAKFASNCLEAMARVTRKLETTLGPETSNLALRVGLNSGPVTAGVLRGQKTRFQLFGDTVNTAARMESTGIKNRIQASQTTADLLTQAGKGHWVKPRNELVEAKGKGKMKTFWVEVRTQGSSVGGDFTHRNGDIISSDISDKTERLVDWNIGILRRLIEQIIARRNSAKAITQKRNSKHSDELVQTIPVPFPLQTAGDAETVIDEVKEIIELPQFDANAFHSEEDQGKIDLTMAEQDQLRKLVSTVAATYNDNPFHNFEHASHVTMSVVKLLSRIVAPDQVFHNEQVVNPKSQINHAVIASSLHDHTYGITSDPLTQFACVFAALIHDADHPGVPNSVLVEENTALSRIYRGKSVAEQNSIDLAFKIFADDGLVDLRAAICPTEVEARRFRQLVVNAVMATDIMDQDLKTLRNARWDKAFHEESRQTPSDMAAPSQEEINRKATIVIEHLIQASDVAHTMQHWHIYRQWNERLFEEMYKAHKAGRTRTNPADFWYNGEIGFFDFYIIPLARKLNECGVFGVSSDEYLNYAQKNREEWVSRGEEIVASVVEKLSQ